MAIEDVRDSAVPLFVAALFDDFITWSLDPNRQTSLDVLK